MPDDFEEELVSGPITLDFEEELVSSPQPDFEEEVVSTDPILTRNELEDVREREAAQKQQTAILQALGEQIKQQEALDVNKWTSKQLQDHYKENPPKNVEEQAQANAAIELKKRQEQELTNQLLPPDVKKEKAVEIKVPERNEEQSLLEAGFSQSDITSKSLTDIIELGIKNLPQFQGVDFSFPPEVKKIIEEAIKASPVGQIPEAFSREESVIAAPVLELMKTQDAREALKSIAQAASGQNRAQIGDIFREIGIDDKTSAILGLLGSLLLPSNIALAKAGAKSLPKGGEKIAETKALEVPTQFKQTEVLPRTKSEIPFKPPLPDQEGFAGNIRLSKITSDKELQDIVQEISKKYKGTIDEQRRGIITNEETQFLADNLGVTPEHLKRVQAGKAFNAEQLKATSDLLLTQTRKVRDFASKIESGDNSTATLLEFQKELQAQALVQTKLSGAKAESGRALQIQRMIAKEVPTELRTQQEMMKALGGQEITEKIAHRLSQVDPSDISAVNKFIRDVTKAKRSDQIYELWVNSILSNPQTHAVNTISNTIRSIVEVPTDIIQAGLEAIFNGTRRATFFGEAPARIVGDLIGIKEGVRRAIHVLRYGASPEQLSKLESDVRIPAIKGMAGEVIRTPGKLLTIEDEFFKAINATGEMYARAYKTAAKEGLTKKALWNRMGELIANPTEEMIQQMSEKALETTFQTPLGKMGNAILQSRSRVPTLRYIIPFVRTPGNIFKQGFRFSPLGFSEAIVKRNSRIATQATIGSFISAMFAQLATEGKITGRAPQDDAERDAFYRSGKKPYSLLIGDKWFPYQRLEPFNTPISLIADGYQILKEGGNVADIGLQSIGLIGQNLSDRTFLSGLGDIVNAVTDPVRYGASWLARFAGGFVPFSGATRFTAQSIDPTFRKPMKGDTGNFISDAGKFISESIQKDIPGLSKGVRPRLNVFGEEAKREGGGFGALTPSKVKSDPVDKELERLGITVRFSDPQAGKVLGVQLSNDERQEIQEKTGKRIKSELDRMVKNKAFKLWSDEQKRERIEKRVDTLRDRERYKMLGKTLSRISKSDQALDFAINEFPRLRKSLKGENQKYVMSTKEARKAWVTFMKLREANPDLVKQAKVRTVMEPIRV